MRFTCKVNGVVAQLIEHLICIQRVVGLSPISSTIILEHSLRAEHQILVLIIRVRIQVLQPEVSFSIG